MSCELTLLHIPDDARKHILDRCDFTSIQVLRKTCWDLRNIIDDVKLESNIEMTHVSVGYDVVRLDLQTVHCPKSKKELAKNVYIEYRQLGIKGCVVRKKLSNIEFKDKILLDEDYVDVFLKDFEIFLKHQRYSLEFFELYIAEKELKKLFPGTNEDHCPSNVSIQFKNLLMSIKVLRVKHLTLFVSQQSDIMDFLPHIEPESLNSICLSSIGIRENLLELDQVAELDQWKHAERVCIYKHYVRCPFRNFAHFADVSVEYESIDLNDILELRMVFTETQHLVAFNVSALRENLPNKQTLTERFGEPNREEDKWFLDIGDPQKVLQLQVNDRVMLLRRNRDELPRNARIIM